MEFVTILPTKLSLAMRKPLYNVAINDADYITQPMIDNKRVVCPFYRVWTNMLKRVYSPAFHAKYPTYLDCTISNEWLKFSIFKKWMLIQNWKNKSLDKDILVPNNKHYSSVTCVFVSKQINTFILDCKATRGLYPIGVSANKQCTRFQARIRIKGKLKHLGYYTTPEQAHFSYIKAKLILFNELIHAPENNYIKSGLIAHKNLLIKDINIA